MVGRLESVKQAALRARKQVAASDSQSKCAKTKAGHQMNGRVCVEEDFEVVHSRGGRINAHGAPVMSKRSPQKGRIAWIGQKSWDMAGIVDFGLGSSLAGCNQDMDNDLAISLIMPLNKSKKKRSKKSVHHKS